MDGDAGLVGSLVDRLATKLPHRTGTNGEALPDDGILPITRATLVELSKTAIETVLDQLLVLLEALSRPYENGSPHPKHIVLSELYILALAADCCSAKWASVLGRKRRRKAPNDSDEFSDDEGDDIEDENHDNDTHNESQNKKSNGAQDDDDDTSHLAPPPLSAALVTRILSVLEVLVQPFSEETSLGPLTIMSDNAGTIGTTGTARNPEMAPDSPMGDQQAELSPHVQVVVEYLTASSWQAAFDYFRNIMYSVRSTMASGGTEPSKASSDAERSALIVVRLFSSSWVDSTRLRLLLQEICANYLQLRKPFQNAAGIAVPLLIARWMDLFPQQMVHLHLQRKKLDGSADTLFDMAQRVSDNAKRKAAIWPFQCSLIFLLPDVFEVASNMKESKSGSIVKKATFLEGLRKSLRNGHEVATQCMVAILRTARHFEAERDSALLSYAMDVQDEVRDAVFRTGLPSSTTPSPVGSTENGQLSQESMALSFVSLAHLNLDGSLGSLLETCISPSAPIVFKIAAVQGCYYFARQTQAYRYHELFNLVVPFMRSQLEAESARALALNQLPNPNDTLMICSILEFLSASPDYLLNDLSNSSSQTSFFKPFLFCVLSPNTSVRKLAMNVADTLFNKNTEPFKSYYKDHQLDSQELCKDLWSRSSKVLLGLCERLASQSTDSDLIALHGCLEARLLLLKNLPELSAVPNNASEVISASSKLETILLVSLCSAKSETCQLVTSCIGIFLEECSIVDKHVESAKASASVLRNGDVFREIASRDFWFTGLVAFQKRIRGLLRRIQFPTTGILNAWETAFDRWIHLSKDVSTATLDVIEDRPLHEWRNYSGFLASLGGICTADQAIILEEPALGGLRWIDRLSSENYEETLLTRYLRLSIQLLACANIRVREAMREVLSTEVSPALYQPLFRALESELEVLFTGALAAADRGQDSEIIFAEQSASLLRALVERLESPSDLGAASSIHLGSLTLNFAKFLDGVPDTPDTLRVKIRVCHLSEAVTKRKEHLILRDDVRIRNQLLEFIFGWIARPRSSFVDQNGSNMRPDDASRLQKDLDRACLKALADLTYRLPLQPSDTQTDAGMNEMKSRMFHTYFNRFLSLLNHEAPDLTRPEPSSMTGVRDEGVPNSDLAISILSNLLSANIDVGLKHSLSIGYHGNVEIRTAFVRVLYNILIQGTEFNNLTDSAVSEKYEELLELLTKDLSLAVSMSSICPSNEVDELAVCLLTIFEQRGLTFELFDALIKLEVEETENESELLRRTSVATKMLSIYGKWKGSQYLKDTLQNVIEKLLSTSDELDLELDPARLGSAEESQKNAQQLRVVAKAFIDQICTSSAKIPTPFRKICNLIVEAVEPRFPDSKYTAVGAFIFLRFFCPAIVAPDVEGLVSSSPSREMRRGLLLIAKVIQNLANNVLFGVKEPYMFSLNDFLVENVFDVTAFMRRISALPDRIEGRAATELFDFGSCVALHRFLYDHWDHVRQNLVARERREYVRSPGELSRGRSPILEPFRNLISNLGPPPLSVSWNRPGISTNNPPLYSRFQNFMLRNAFKGTDSLTTARAVYDGGESKDGLSIICIVLRHIETEGIDYDTLLFYYFKLASRLWHEPFGLLIDATCFNGRNEPQDDIFRMLELLTPSELARSLSRIYIYNMNSAFKRCFRRLLRISTRGDGSVFHPKNVEYHLIGSLQELQTHFQLNHLHLPKETISVVTDTRYMYQPVTRLSRSKGNIEVVIKVGSQFVQITTAKKQEVFAGFRLSTTVNDIFRLGDIDEAPASIQAEDESTFGLRADSGKIVMCFTSPKKTDIVASLRSAKTKYGKDSRSHKPPERLIRPQDVPGTLLNLAFTNLSSSDPVLRLSSYNLLGALCKAFKFSSASRLVCTKDLSVPPDAIHFIVDISRELAQTEPQLTADFLTEFFVGWENVPEPQKAQSLAYMAPWLPGLRTSILVNEADAEKGRERVAVLFRKLIDVAILDHTLVYTLEQVVWPAIAQDEVLLDIFLDELMKTAMGYGVHEETLDIISSIVVGIGSVTLRGKLMARLRKALNRSSYRPTKYLPENAAWAEICMLLQFCLALSFNHGVQSQLFLPEVFHIVTMLSNTGNHAVRMLVYKLLINSVHAACTSFVLDDVKASKLRSALDTLSEPRGDVFPTHPTLAREGASISTIQDSGATLAATEHLATVLFDICSIAAPSVDVCNTWRSRWMSLVASTAFQNNPAIQPRAFTVMGYLAREEVDDDLLYQVLVALRNSINRFDEESNSEMLVSITTSLSKMMAKLPSASRYGLQLFWLAISLVRLVPAALFNCAAQFLEAVLTNIGSAGDIKGDDMIELLLQGRTQLEEAATLLDETYGIYFNQDNFHFAVCACVARGLTDTITRPAALRVLSAFLAMTNGASDRSSGSTSSVVAASPYLALIRARAVGLDELRDSLWLAGINPEEADITIGSRSSQHVKLFRDDELLLITAMEMVDFQYLEDTVQARSLQWLNELAGARPAVMLHLSSSMRSILDDVLLHGQNAATLDAAHTLLRTLSSDRRFVRQGDSSNTMADVLEGKGFGGLWQSCSMGSMEDFHRDCFELTEKLIELIII